MTIISGRLRRLLTSLIGFALVMSSLVFVDPSTSLMRLVDCVGGVQGAAGIGGVDFEASSDCDAADSSEHTGGPVIAAPPTQTIDCGPPTYAGGGGTPDTVDDPCRPAKVSCSVPSGTTIDPAITTTVTLVQVGTNWRLQSVNCAVKPATPGGGLTGMVIRQKAIELLPTVPIRSAPADGRTFVNMKTVLWLDSAKTRPLGPVTLLGHRIGVEITVASVKWDFGDGDTESGPLGRPYDTSCNSKECDGFWGHDYAAVSKPTVTATVRWAATYTIDGSGPQPVPGGPISRGSSSLALVVREARGVLVPNPGE